MLRLHAGTDPGDAALIGGLEWLRGWAENSASMDSDPDARLIALGCVNLQVSASWLGFSQGLGFGSGSRVWE